MRLGTHLLAILLLPAAAAAQIAQPTQADYRRAEQLHERNVRALVDRNQPSYTWSADGRTLLYETNDAAGPHRYRIDPAARTREALPPAPAAAPAAPPTDVLPSPDGRLLLFVRDNDLWVRPAAGGAERRLTRDGAENFAYGTPPDFLYMAIPRLSGALKLPPAFVSWSPDGRHLIGKRFDQRAVKPYPYVAWTPADGDLRPRLYQPRQAIVGDPDQPVEQIFLIDVSSAQVRQSQGPQGWAIDTSTATWSKTGDRAWFLAAPATGNGGALFAFDPATMAFTAVITEHRTGQFFFNAGSLYNAANVRILGDGREAIWFSSRDGWGNLYLYDLRTGRVRRQLTRGPGVVLDIVAVDEAKRRLFFTAGGRRTGGDPYQRQLYAVGLDGGRVRAITDDDLDHEIAGPIAPFFRPFFRAPPGVGALSPDNRWFVDLASRLDRPPVTTLRSVETGAALMELDRADPSRFLAAGGRAPERFHVKAADGRTDIWGAIWLPPGYDPKKRYPVIDGIYAGPQYLVAPRAWNDATGARPQMFDRNSLAQLGFVVVTIDARGTPGRSAAFGDVGFPNFADPQLDDHVAAIRQLARLYPGIDLDRVGVYGHSLGGYAATRALLRYPDFYKVGVASAGVYAWERFGPSYNKVLGEPDYGDGRTVRPDASSVARNLAAVDNTTLAARLRGHLLLVYGELDENAPPGNTMAMVAALTKAGRPYDLMMLPNTTHQYGSLNYFTLRLWNYFVEHLGAAEPLTDYAMAATPAPAAAAAGVPADPPSRAPSAEAVAAVRRIAVPATAAAAPLSAGEARAIGHTVAGARLIGFGETGHGSREPLEQRNRLIRHLVEHGGLTAVAIESGLQNTQALGDWVAGGAGDPEALLGRLSWNFGDLRANLDLVRWLRDWNARHPDRTVRFHGLDASTRIALVDGKPQLDAGGELDAVLAYLRGAAPAASAALAGRLETIRPQLRSDRYQALDAAGRARFDALLADADVFLAREASPLAAASGADALAWARRYVWDLGHLPGLLAGWTTDPREIDKIRLSIVARDAVMAEHALWLLGREGARGRMLVFAANGHVAAAPMVGSVMRLFADQPATMGIHLREALGGGYRTILTGSARGKGGDDPTLGSIDRAFVAAGRRGAYLDGRALGRRGWWARPQTLAQGDARIDELVPADALDGLLMIPALSPAPTLTAP